MAYPDKPIIENNYTAIQQAQGDNTFPGTQLDADLANLKASTDAAIDFMKGSFDATGLLKPTVFPAAPVDVTAYVSAINASAAAAATSATAAANSASAAATSAANTATTVANLAPLKANNLSDLANIPAARTNLGLGGLAVKSAVSLADVPAGMFTADASGRGKFAAGFLDFSMVPNGSVIQVVDTHVSAVATGTGLIPVDDTIPQITEGDQYMSLAITPLLASSKLLVMVTLYGSHSVAGDFAIAALFRDSGANALAVGWERSDTAGGKGITFSAFVDSTAASATTFKVRAGGNSAGTFTFNGNGGTRRFGGVVASSITIMEIKA